MGRLIAGTGFEFAGTGVRGASRTSALADEPSRGVAAHNDQLGKHRSHAERRHSFRVTLPARASLWSKGQLCGHYAVVDLSLGGCALEGGPARARGEHVHAVLHVPHRGPIVVPAQVRRSIGDQVALVFERPTPVVEDVLQDVIVETFARVRTRDKDLALVVEPRHAVRHTLVRTLRELGRKAIGVATALDAVQLLVEEGDNLSIVFIEAESDVVPSLELVEFIAHNHPSVKRVLIGEPGDVARHWLSEASGEVHALIDTTTDREALQRLLRKLDRTPAEGSGI
jgi:hypothetical protein